MFGLRKHKEPIDPWDYYYELRLFDPTETDDRGHPKQVVVIGLRLNAHRHIVRSTAQLGAMIAEIMDPARRREYLDGSNYFNYNSCCSRCGRAFELDHCAGCRRPIKYDGSGAITGIAVPPIVRDWLESRGYVFTG